MAGLPPTYSEATTPYPPAPAPGQPSAPPVPYPEKGPHPPEQYAGYPPQSQVPYPQAPYPPTQQGPYPPYPPQQAQPQGYPPQGYPPQQPAYPQQTPVTTPLVPVTTPQAPPTSANITVITQQQPRRVFYTGNNSSFTGILIYSAIAILCFFPIGIPAFLVALCAYSEFSKGDIPKAVGLSRLASGLATTAFIIGVICIILSFSVRYTVFTN